MHMQEFGSECDLSEQKQSNTATIQQHDAPMHWDVVQPLHLRWSCVS